MASVIYVYSRFGIKLGEFYQDVQREWLLNDAGAAVFSLSASEEIKRLAGRDLRNLVEFGNIVYVPNDLTGDWVGVITTREWAAGILSVEARSGEFILSFSSPQSTVKMSGTGGAVFQQMLSTLNIQLDTKVQPGNIYLGGNSIDATLEGIDLFSNCLQVSEQTGQDFNIEPVLEGGKIILWGNWYKQRGVQTNLVLAEGKNLMKPDGNIFIERGENIANRITGFPDNASKKKEKVVLVSDEDSAQQYGPRWAGEAYTDVADDETLLSHCKAVLKKRKQPARLINGIALDQDNTFEKLRIGNQIRVELYSAGLKEGGKLGAALDGRITGMRYNDANNRMELVLEEVL